MFALVVAALVALPGPHYDAAGSPHYDNGGGSHINPWYPKKPAGGITTLFDAPLNTNGLTAANPATSWPVTGVAAPSVAWWGDDPTGSGGKTTHAFTETGSTTEVDTPFCPDGSHSDVTSACMKARRFDGVNDYYKASSNITPVNSADFTACIIARPSANGPLLSNREGGAGTGEGFLIHAGGAQPLVYVENHAGAQTSEFTGAHPSTARAWLVSCMRFDYDGNLEACLAGSCAGGGAHAGGTILSTAATTVGGTPDGASKATGDIAAVFFWNSLLDATDMEELFEYFVGILDTKGAPVAFTSTGPNTCFIDGKLETFGDDWPMIGCELPPGVTGAGSPASGFYSGEALTNSILYSRDLDSWVDNGTPTPTATSTDLFRDGRSTYKITDNDAGVIEHVYVNVVHGLSNGEKAQICVYAKGSDANQDLDMYVTEYNGACVGGAASYQLTAQALTASWGQYEFTHTITDATCDTLRVRICPGDHANACETAAAVGDVEAVVQLFLDQDWCPPIYIETEATAVGANDQDLRPSLTNVVDGTGTLKAPLTLSFDFTPMELSGAAYVFDFKDTSSGNDYVRMYIVKSDGDPIILARSTEEGAARILWNYTAADLTWTNGTTYAMEIYIDLSGSATEVKRDGVVLVPVSTSAMTVDPNGPDSLDILNIGHNTGGNQAGASFENVQVTQ